PAPLEERVLLHEHLDPQVAPRRTGVAGLALPAELQPHAALDAGPHIDLQVGHGVDSSRSPAARAGIGHAHTLAAPGRAGGRALEEPARLDDLPLPSAVVARDGDGSLAGSRSLAVVAKLLPIDVDWLGRAPRRLEQLDLELEEQVLPRPRP